MTVTDAKVSIGYPIASAVNVSIRIEPYRHWLQSVTECPRLKIKVVKWGTPKKIFKKKAISYD